MAVSDTRKRFNAEFRRNLDAGNKTFEFEGKTYSTETAPAMPKNPPMPPKRRGMTLEEAYEGSTTLPEKYAPERKMERSRSSESSRVGEARSTAGKARQRYSETMPADRNSAMLEDIRRADTNVSSRMKERGYAKGGMVRGCGKAVKGRGKGKMY
jgi:hypothetical protein